MTSFINVGGPWAVLGLLGCIASASVVFNGASVQIDDLYYFIDPHVAGELPIPRLNHTALAGGGFAAVTVVQSAGKATSLDCLLQSWDELDDVFGAPFLAGGVYVADSRFLNTSEPCSVQQQQQQQQQQQLLNISAPVQSLPPNASLPSGPYFVNVHTGRAHRALRLYDDFTNSFTGSLLQKPDGSVQTLSAQIPTAMTLTVGVPSRLYYAATPARPLAGVRVGIKDLFCVRGARRSNANRAWYHLYPACAATSPAVQRLVDAGAVVVGYQMLSQFANGDTYGSDAVDMHMPFNPRGDGYSVPQGSSAGAGASVAAYPWLDLALGSDTGGSVRGPAKVNGLFGNRPTTGLVTLDHVTPLSPTLDTPGFLARDPALWDAAQRVLYGANYTSLADVAAPDYPKTVYTFRWPSQKGPEVDRMLGAFLNATLAITGAAKVEEIDLEALWASTRPTEVGDVTLATYLNLTYATLVSSEQWDLVGKPFFADYAKKHDGRKPYVNPSPNNRWEWARQQPASAYPAAKRQQETFRDWFRTRVLAATGDARCSSALLVYSDYYGAPDLRTTLRPVPPVRGLEDVFYSSFSGTPDFALPLGEVRTRSSVTGKDEPLPVSADVMAAHGCDGLVTRLAIELARAGAVKVPKAGGTLDGGEVLFRRQMGSF
ncbi:hypothetical protein V2A60_005492 [Cordyceps javanica]|uniref:Amidase n=1 Tax=Cordyceps javanica TaxID=43265 RepID=A0A545UYC8_9HYPO|nr:Amidase [Cordyceps javanica]TQW06316.1 Amidase [Cordyceps javanica]